MDITAETIEKIEELAKPVQSEIVDAFGRKAAFASKQLYEVKAEPPAITKTTIVCTLEGFAELVRIQLDGHQPKDFFIHVDSATQVSFNAKQADAYGRRITPIVARPVEFRGFPFGMWMGQEEFAIGLASLFADSADLEYVLGMASSITSDSTAKSEDDGFTQTVSVKKGLRLKESVSMRPRVSLAPFRIFPEVKQPESEFLFRARCDEGKAPVLMLTEADGGVWRLEAIATIAAYLKELNLGTSIIA